MYFFKNIIELHNIQNSFYDNHLDDRNVKFKLIFQKLIFLIDFILLEGSGLVIPEIQSNLTKRPYMSLGWRERSRKWANIIPSPV